MRTTARSRAAMALAVTTSVAFSQACAALPAAAAAPNAWTVVASPNPGTNDTLLGMSCATATSCVAVGSDENPDVGETALAEAWAGSTWNSSVLSNVVKSLSDVSCASPQWCVAVGDAAFPGSDGPAAVEHWDGNAWTVAALPNVRRYNSLSGVSCASTSWCVGVGYATEFLGTGHTVGQYKTLVVTWDGSSWAVVPSPNRDTANVLTDVSCASVTSCVAVGYTNVDLGFDEHGERLGVLVHTLAETWDGTSWTITPTPNPSEESDALQGVSCATPTSCVAVGGYAAVGGVSPAYATLTETWDGETWKVVSSPSPGARNSSLRAVSCPTASSCVAVGWYVETERGPTPSLVETWDGTAWVVSPSPNPDANNLLHDVSCASTTSCVAVGGRSPANFGSVRTLVLSSTPYQFLGFDGRVARSRWKPGRTVPLRFTLAGENGAALETQVADALATRVELWSSRTGGTVLSSASCRHRRIRFACDLRLPATLVSGAAYWVAAQAQLSNGSWVTVPATADARTTNPVPLFVR